MTDRPKPAARVWAAVTAAALVAAVAACAPSSDRDGGMGDDVVIDSTGVGPGTVFRYGPATAAALADPPSAPIVEGDSGQVSIHGGFFGLEPCAAPLRPVASWSGDTIRVRLVSGPDTTLEGPCTQGEQKAGYALVVGQFEPGDYAVRVIHEGDRARSPALDTVYHGIRIHPPRRR